MNRSGRVISLSLAAIGTMQLLFPHVVAQIFSLDKEVSLFAITAAVIAYGVWLGPLKFLSGNLTLRMLGLMAMSVGVVSLNSPTLFDIRANYLPIADMFLILESGVLLSIVGFETKPARRLAPMMLLSVMGQLVYRRLSRAQPSTAQATVSPSH